MPLDQENGQFEIFFRCDKVFDSNKGIWYELDQENRWEQAVRMSLEKSVLFFQFKRDSRAPRKELKDLTRDEKNGWKDNPPPSIIDASKDAWKRAHKGQSLSKKQEKDLPITHRFEGNSHYFVLFDLTQSFSRYRMRSICISEFGFFFLPRVIDKNPSSWKPNKGSRKEGSRKEGCRKC